MYYNYPYSTKL